MRNNVELVLSTAREFLKKQHYDAAHDLSHHESVWLTAQDIAQHIEFQGSLELLHIACLWHDLLIHPYPPEIHKDHKKVTRETAEYVRNLMINHGFSLEDAEVVYIAIRYHEFDDKPRNNEGKVLFDADKLDVLNIERIRRFVQSDTAGNVPSWKRQSAIIGAQIFLKQMRAKLQHEYSKQLFDQKIISFFNDPEIKAYADRYEINLEELKRSIQSRNFIDRLLALLRFL